ncbi:MAG: glutamate--cysteine ligase [Pseudomonadota bacterium]
MGLEINQIDFSAEDQASYIQRLEDNLAALDHVLARPGFGTGAGSLGAELEMYVVDKAGLPLAKNEEILAVANDPQLTLELNRYNLEYNLTPYLLSDAPFEATEQEISTRLETANTLAQAFGGRIVPIGILPTLTQAHFGASFVTNRKRYYALVAQLIRRRGANFRIDINGADPLKLDMTDITLEGANTSFQVHYRVNPADFVDCFNAFQLVTPLVVAISANSPTLFGHKLWQETRVPLFKQSIDCRVAHRYGWHEPARVHFGYGWARRNPADLFREVARLYEPLLPVCGDEDPLETAMAGKVPTLAELKLLQGTVWLWNRPIYDDAAGGMLRVEARALPAGPTPADMVAGAAFLIGLAEGTKPDINALLPGIPFQMAEHNFYRAAQHGLAARIVWPSKTQTGCVERDIRDVIEEMLPVAAAGLARIGIGEKESGRYLGIIEQRLRANQTGADWQLRKLEKAGQRQDRQSALHEMLESYIGNSRSNQPVGEWQV